MSRRKPYTTTEPAGAPPIWRTLEEKAGAKVEPEAEMPGGFVDAGSLTRRSFFKLSAAGAATASLAGCARRPRENILPFSEAPEYVVPGIPLHFATATQRRSEAIGLLVISHEGRPTKIEGNPLHNGSRGSTDLLAQAAILDMYDDDRSRRPAQGGCAQESTFEDFDRALDGLLREHGGDGGRRLRILAQPTTSPSFIRIRDRLRAALPEARVHTYSPVNESNARAGAALAYGRPLAMLVAERAEPYQLALPRVYVAADSDFLCTEPGAVRASRAFADGRRVMGPESTMNRLYAVEAVLSVTGAKADHRLRLASRDVGRFLVALARRLAADGVIELGELAGVVGERDETIDRRFVRVLSADLAENVGASAILVGSRQPAWVHALGHFLNQQLGNVGRTIAYVEPADATEPDQLADLRELVEAMSGGQVSALVILGGNPVHDAPADLGFGEKLGRDGLTSIHLSMYRDETSRASTWHVPRAHELEAWGDLRSLDGTVAVVQPLIAPLVGGRSDLEMLARIAGERSWRGYGLVRASFRESRPDRLAFEADFRRALHTGVVPGTEGAAIRDLALVPAAIAAAIAEAPSTSRALGQDNLEVIFAEDLKLHDGRYANNLWLQELPDPITKLVWDNAALMSPATARELELVDDPARPIGPAPVITLSKEGAGSIEIPVFVVPGHADWCVTLPIGWGRSAAGRYGNGKGFDVHPLRTTTAFHFTDGVRVQKTARTYELVQTQRYHSMEGRPLAIDATFEPIENARGAYRGLPAYRDNPDFPREASVEPTTPPLWEQANYDNHIRWGLNIDLTVCTGCSACVIACQAENNIACSGKEQIRRGREMSWLRIDRYYVGEELDDPLVAMQVVACQQCEEAPCETVCPVNATAHSPEGLNDMSYNRCIGTRYCANNCPYKVRRFNYLDFHYRADPARNRSGVWPSEMHFGEPPELRRMQFNPNVTVRGRGVMEKCTYCVQRIQAARMAARREERPFRGEDVTPACVQACPTQALVFGDLNDEGSAVRRLAEKDRTYKLLVEIGTHPRTTYAGQVRNPNPRMFG